MTKKEFMEFIKENLFEIMENYSDKNGDFTLSWAENLTLFFQEIKDYLGLNYLTIEANEGFYICDICGKKTAVKTQRLDAMYCKNCGIID